MTYTQEQKIVMLNILSQLEGNLSTIPDPGLRATIQTIFIDPDSGRERDLSSYDANRLVSILQDSDVVKGLKKANFDGSVLGNLYTQAGIDVSSLGFPSRPEAEDVNFDIMKGGLPAILATIAGFVFTKNWQTALTWGAAVGGGGALLGNKEEIAEMLKPITESLGVGGGDLLGGLSKLLGGGAAGTGSIMSELGKTLESLSDDDSIGGLFKKTLELVKDQPLLAAAIGYGLHKMFKGGLSFGGIFSNLPSMAMAVAVAWAAQSILGLDGANRNQGLIVDAPEQTPAQLAAQNAAPSNSVQVGS